MGTSKGVTFKLSMIRDPTTPVGLASIGVGGGRFKMFLDSFKTHERMKKDSVPTFMSKHAF